MKPILNCTKAKPMPRVAVRGAVYFHHGAEPKPGEPEMKKEGDTQTWLCPNCDIEFEVRRGGKKTIKQIQERLASDKARGLRFPT